MVDYNQGEIRQPGGKLASDIRDVLTRIRDNLAEAEKMETLDQADKVAVAAKECMCKSNKCKTACPAGKDVMGIMQALRKVDFHLLISEFGEVMDQIKANLNDSDIQKLTPREYFETVREGHLQAIREIVDSKPDLKRELSKLRFAFDKQMEESPFSLFTGALCPAPCEADCVRVESGHAPTKIKSTEYNLSDTGIMFGWADDYFKVPAHVEKLPEKVLVVGGGPSAISSAYWLAKGGADVTIAFQEDKMGGLLENGIPQHKFRKDILEYYEYQFEKMGIRIQRNTTITKADTEDFDRTVVAVGVSGNETARKPTVEGFAELEAMNHPALMPAMTHLDEHNSAVDIGEDIKVKKGKTAVVLGAGDTATDCVQTSIRQGYTVIQADRNPELSSDRPEAGTGQSSKTRNMKEKWASKQEDLDATGGLVLYNSQLSRMDAAGDDKIKLTFTFNKPTGQYTNISKEHRRKFKEMGAVVSEVDTEVGDIITVDSKKIGARLRDSENNLVDYVLGEDGKYQRSEGRVEGKVDGSTTIISDKVPYAYGYLGADKNPFVAEMGVKTAEIKNNRTNVENTYAAGDIATDNWIIVVADADGKKAAYNVLHDIKMKSQNSEMTWEDARAQPSFTAKAMDFSAHNTLLDLQNQM